MAGRNSSAGKFGLNGKSDDIRAEILAAAAEAFRQKGYAGASIDLIAESMGSTKGLIYYYFKSKADLFFSIHIETMQRSLSRVKLIAAEPTEPCDRLWQMLYHQAMDLMDNFSMQKVTIEGVQLHSSGSTTPTQRQTLEQVVAMRDEFEQLFVSVLKEGIAAKQFREISPDLGIKLILGSVNWMSYWFRPELSRSREANERIAEEAANLTLLGLSSSNSAGEVAARPVAPRKAPVRARAK